MNALRADAPMTPSRQQAQKMAQQELAQGKYHLSPSPSPSPSQASTPPHPTPTPTPTQAAAHHASSGTTTVLVIVLIIVFGVALLLILRKVGMPRWGRDKDEKKTGEEKTPDKAKQKSKHPAAPIVIPLTGAALHRHQAEQAAGEADWQEAIRERFRAVIAVLDERGLLPERRDRTADEAARDAGLLLPEHADALREAARAFDEVEYGEYSGTPEGYAVISGVDQAVSTGAAQAVSR
ncbi:DUF4129 domain-containing protein [Actinospica robiniae]|uniref:DUF4129 domain-containing protein n=1 Tax=Actinospica robiniae TaxID=304901 RepID=UPI00041C8791|nr:DUF4129 domain-containing protein [Actinospica robiniae]